MITNEPSWRPMAASDLDRVSQIAGQIHASLPERAEVLAEKFRLFPQGCFIFQCDGKIVGYAIAHPWTRDAIPPLDSFLGELPDAPNCLYLHDAALLPEGRGHAGASQLIAALRRVANSLDLTWLALVSVYQSDLLWSRFGFSAAGDLGLSAKLACYGATAKYMTASV
jgi:GNAT superfamily N-acetyltransferase